MTKEHHKYIIDIMADISHIHAGTIAEKLKEIRDIDVEKVQWASTLYLRLRVLDHYNKMNYHKSFVDGTQ